MDGRQRGEEVVRQLKPLLPGQNAVRTDLGLEVGAGDQLRRNPWNGYLVVGSRHDLTAAVEYPRHVRAVHPLQHLELVDQTAEGIRLSAPTRSDELQRRTLQVPADRRPLRLD